MDVLLISHCFSPWLTPRSIQLFKLVNQLVNIEGVRLTTLQADVDQRVERDEWLDLGLSPRVERVRIPEHTGTGFGLRLLDKLFDGVPDPANRWIAGASPDRIRRSLDRPVEAVVSFSTPVTSHIVAGRFAVYSKLPWIAFFSDPFMSNPYVRMNRRQRFLNALVEKWIFKKADYIVFVNDDSRNLALRRHGNKFRNKSRIVAHSYEPSLYPDEQASKDGPLIFRHAGDFYGRRSPESFFAGLQLCFEKRPDLRGKIRVELYGRMPEEHAKLISIHNLKNDVFVYPPVGYSQSLALMKTAHVNVVVDAPDQVSPFLTSKIVDYLGAGRPILAISPKQGATARFMQEIGGEVASPSDPDALSNILIELIVAGGQRIDAVRVPPDVLDKYSSQNIAKAYHSIVTEAIAKSKA